MPGATLQLSDADKAVDGTVTAQGHVSKEIHQSFTTERSRTVFNETLKLEARENIVKDQFGNLYVVFTAKLIDDEVYAVTKWVAHPHKGLVKEVREASGSRRFDDACLAYLQHTAFVAFGRATVQILKGRNAGNLPLTFAQN